MKKIVYIFVSLCVMLSICGCKASPDKQGESTVSDSGAQLSAASYSQSRIPKYRSEFYYGMTKEEIKKIVPQAEEKEGITSLVAYDTTSDLAIVKLAKERNTEVRIMYHFDNADKLNSITCTASSPSFTKEDMYQLAENFYDSYGGKKDPKVEYASNYTIYSVELKTDKGSVAIDYEVNDVSSNPSIGVAYDMPAD